MIARAALGMLTAMVISCALIWASAKTYAVRRAQPGWVTLLRSIDIKVFHFHFREERREVSAMFMAGVTGLGSVCAIVVTCLAALIMSTHLDQSHRRAIQEGRFAFVLEFADKITSLLSTISI